MKKSDFRQVSLEEWLLWAKISFGKNSLPEQWLNQMIFGKGEDFLVKFAGMKDILNKIQKDQKIPNDINWGD